MCAASLASRDEDYCLIPEIPIHLTTLLRHIKYTLKVKGHTVIVAAEGAGEHLGIIIIIISIKTTDYLYIQTQIPIPPISFHSLTANIVEIFLSFSFSFFFFFFSFLGSSGEVDASGNPVLLDIGKYLKNALTNYFKEEEMETSIKYIDPTYM